MTILLDRLCQDSTYGPATKAMTGDGCVPLRIHPDVMQLAEELAVRDADKLLSTQPHLFMPAVQCWFEWPMGAEGDMAILFSADASGDVREGRAVFYAWRHAEETPAYCPLDVDFENFGIRYAASRRNDAQDPIVVAASVSKLKPVILAILALINSPKVIRRDPARLDRLNRKRKAAGRYTFHPHHVVRLNVDKKVVRVGSSAGGDGATRALHFVRAHLRLWNGSYILVQPHWRGDPQVGIVSPNYEIDRQNSKWRD